ncbi:halo transducer protein [Halobellus ruber]|uniref:Halo transducer protein n=1 Tax=Halobellus ruber TaxID=2761102 RepID=A0A7J9SGM9_9EURY|nr:halo transducer protein [Halobellus ruber]MBB6645146.1 halo transducer protein [Halobellus ruber]
MNTERTGGVTVADVVEAVDGADPATVRDALEPVTDDGAVSRDAVEATVSDVSKLLATAETRIELAGDAYADAVAAADPVADVPTVRARLDALGERLSEVESRVPDLRPNLSVPEDVQQRSVAAYELAVEIREIVVTAREAIEAADDLSFDAEQFESWATRPDRRYDEFADDVEVVTESAAELETAAVGLDDADAPAVRWADATMRARVVSLLAADLRSELRDLRAIADRTDDPFRAGLDSDLRAAEEQIAEAESLLATRADPAWQAEFGDEIAAVEAALDAFEPPVEWGAVDRLLADHRPQRAGEGAE